MQTLRPEHAACWQQTQPKLPKTPAQYLRGCMTPVLLKDTWCQSDSEQGSFWASVDVCRWPAFRRASVLCNGLGQALPRAGEATSISSVEFFVFEATLSSKSTPAKKLLMALTFSGTPSGPNSMTFTGSGGPWYLLGKPLREPWSTKPRGDKPSGVADPLPLVSLSVRWCGQQLLRRSPMTPIPDTHTL